MKTKYRSAQTEVISVLMITGIIISLVGAAYMWGVPMIDKRTATTDLDIAEKFMLDLDKKIKEIANSGGGEVSLEIPFGLLRVVPYDSADKTGKNNIALEYISKQPIVLGSQSYLMTNNLDEPAVYGSEPRIIAISGESSGNGYLITLNAHYRELYSGNDRFNIELYTDTGKTEKVGKDSVTISFIENKVLTDQDFGGSLTLTSIQIRI
ncbi:MAG: hypothetical protein ISS36_01955 [Candidatus Aenigmarchaeota archaeon]|nr:hypothetical protein [Candidatus Aenigmarchaeota archaeon]